MKASEAKSISVKKQKAARLSEETLQLIARVAETGHTTVLIKNCSHEDALALRSLGYVVASHSHGVVVGWE